MRHAYALLRGYDYEGDTLLGVYTEEWRALEAMAAWIRDNPGRGDSFSVVACALDDTPGYTQHPVKSYNYAGERE